MVMWCNSALYQRGLYYKMVDGEACALTPKYSIAITRRVVK